MPDTLVSYEVRPLKAHSPSLGIVSSLFVTGVLSQNLQLLPVTAEYQPWVYLLVLPHVAWVKLDLLWNPLRPSTILVIAAAMIVVLLATVAAFQGIVLQDLLRLVVFPLVTLATLAYLTFVPLRTVRVLLTIHMVFLAMALVTPESASLIASQITSRLNDDSLTWTRYFYSEPSYAALVFVFLAFFLCFKAGALRLYDAAALTLLSASTQSVTGVVGAFVIAFTLLWQRSPLLLVSVLLGALLIISTAVVSIDDGSSIALHRLVGVAYIGHTLADQSFFDILAALNVVEPSGMWRLLSNLYALSCISDMPYGQGSTGLAHILAQSLCAPSLSALLASNSSLLQIDGDFYAQSILANLVVMSGLLGLVIGVGLIIVQMRGAFLRPMRSSLPLALFFLMSFALWQSAWAAPSTGILLAIALSPRVSIAESNVSVNRRLTTQ